VYSLLHMTTLQDIANLSGASKSTVSLVLNGKPGIGAEARARVLQAAESLGYRAKKAPGAKKVSVVRFLWIVKHGHILNSDHRGFVADYLQGIERASQDQQVRVEVMVFDGFNPERLVEAMGSGASGVVILATELSDDDLGLLASVPVPKVFIDNHEEDMSQDFVDMDNTASVQQVVDHLWTQGHRRIGLVQSQLESKNFSLRQQAFERALARNSVTLAAQDLFLVDPTYEASAQRLRSEFRDAKDLPTALFCVNDVIAYGALHALGALKIAVPERVSVVGFDDLPSSSYMQPPLTSMAVSKQAIGSRAFQLLKERMENPKKPSEKVLVGGELVIRKSVRPLKVGKEGAS